MTDPVARSLAARRVARLRALQRQATQWHAALRRAQLRDQRRDERLIDDAATAAPKPLSMFTTTSPAAHELSMPSSADSPPNAAP